MERRAVPPAHRSSAGVPAAGALAGGQVRARRTGQQHAAPVGFRPHLRGRPRPPARANKGGSAGRAARSKMEAPGAPAAAWPASRGRFRRLTCRAPVSREAG